MANTSGLKEVNRYMIEDFTKNFGQQFGKRKVPVGRHNIMKEFSAVSADGNTIIHICHHSGRTSGGKNPVGKINGLFSKCFLLEKTSAKNKYIYFTNEEFYNIFTNKSKGLLDDIQLKCYTNLTNELSNIITEIQKSSSLEMSK